MAAGSPDHRWRARRRMPRRAATAEGARPKIIGYCQALPAIIDVEQEIATLGFMLVVGGVLAVIAVFAAIALWRLPRP
jgi:hypothetical protein